MYVELGTIELPNDSSSFRRIEKKSLNEPNEFNLWLYREKIHLTGNSVE